MGDRIGLVLKSALVGSMAGVLAGYLIGINVYAESLIAVLVTAIVAVFGKAAE